MLLKLIILLTVVPFVELYLLVKLTEWWGSFWLTVALIVGTGIVGGVLARHEGLRVLSRIRASLGRGEIPTDALLDGLLILIAGAFLITPGVITDGLGLLLLVAPSRALARGVLKRWISRRMREGEVTFFGARGFRPVQDEPPPGAPPLEDEPPER